MSETQPTSRSGSSTWRLDVIAGPNAGATIALPAGNTRLGGGAGDDVLLAGLDAGHAELALAADGRLALSAAGPVALGRRPVRPGGAPVTLRHGTELSLGGAVVRVVHTGGEPARKRRSWVLIAVAPAILGLALVAHGVGRPADAEQAAAPQSVPAPVAAVRADPAVALEQLRQRLAEVGLGERVTLRLAGGAILVEGAMGQADAASWQTVRTWYDGRFGSGPALVTRMGAAPAPAGGPDLRVRAVALGTVPFLIAADGARYTEGAVLAGGWTIARIAPNEVILTRGAQTSVLGF